MLSPYPPKSPSPTILSGQFMFSNLSLWINIDNSRQYQPGITTANGPKDALKAKNTTLVAYHPPSRIVTMHLSVINVFSHASHRGSPSDAIGTIIAYAIIL